MELSVGDVMTKGVIWISAKDSVQKAARVMKENDIESVMVFEKGKGVGIVTEQDIIWKVVAEQNNPGEITALDIMSSPLIKVGTDVDIDDAARLMRNNDIRRLPVEKDDKIVGMLTSADIVRVEPTLHLLIEESSKWDISSTAPEEGILSGVCEACGNYSEDLINVNGRTLCEDCRE